MKRTFRFFDKFEDKLRAALSKYPLVYAFIAGVGVVSFWRGIWEVSDTLGIPPLASLIGGLLLLMSIGLLVTEFLGNRIIITGLRGEKKLEEKTLQEIEAEETFLTDLKVKIENIERMLEKLSNNN